MTNENTDVVASQVKAARALLAWSQQDLARRASLSISTIADFERGERKPVPDNLAAIRNALEQAGIAFVKGGAIVASNSIAQPRLLKGQPIRLVDATEILNWASSRTCQDTMPELISRLIRSSAGPAASLHFPSGDSVQHPGWDGVCTVSDPLDSYIPRGISAWEIGTQASKIQAKADEDYKKRTKDPLGVDPTHSTFVFVTPRRWFKRQQWANERKKEGCWADVRALDVDDLVHWIELFPSVGIWLANILGRRPAGVLPIDEVWREWSHSTRWPLTEDLTLVGRDEQAAALLRWLYGSPSVLGVQADSPLESAAFIYATVRQLPLDYQKFYIPRMLVASTADAARMLSASSTPLVIAMDQVDPGLATSLAESGHHVCVTSARMETHEKNLQLARPSREGIRLALVGMGIDQDSAERLARDSGRSLAVLRRLIPAAPGATLPKWSEPQHARVLLPALCVVGWDEANESDRAILERLSGQTYEQWVIELTPWLISADAPLRKQGTTWKLASPRDAWFRLAPFLSSVDMENYVAVVTDVFAQSDPKYDLKPDERWIAPLRNRNTNCSGLLRAGISETLILMSVFNDRIPTVPDSSVYAARVIHTLFDKADTRRWWELSALHESLAEAAPDEFLTSVEDSLSLDPSPIAGLFVEDGGPFGAAYHSNLLWALEALAWSPRYLSRVTLILAKLARLDPGGKFANRPKNSLRNIFLLWLPHTHASLEQRLRVLDTLRRIEVDTAWQLMMRLIPTGHDIAEPSGKARWRDFSPQQEEIVTYGLLAKAVHDLADRLLQDAGTHPERWEMLIESFGNFPPECRSHIVQALKIAISKISDQPSRMRLRRSLQAFLHNHRAHPDAQWRLPENDLAGFDESFRSLEPKELGEKFGWLFSSSPNLPEPTGKGWQADKELAQQLRVEALREILSIGEQEVFTFANTVEAPAQVGFALPDALGDEKKARLILAQKFSSDTDIDLQIARGMTYALINRRGDDWIASTLAEAMSNAWSTDSVIRLTLTLRPSRLIWDWLSLFGPAVEAGYWTRVDPVWIQGTPEDRIFAVKKLLEAKRARLAVHCAGHSPKDFPSFLLLEALVHAVQEPWPGNSGNESTMFIYAIEEILLHLDKVGDITEGDLVRVEWALLPLLEHSRRPPIALQRNLSASPEFFETVVCAIYRPAPDSGVAEDDPGDLDRAKAIASHAYQLLHSWNVVPGQENSVIDAARLEQWVKDARILLKKCGRLEVGDQHIGSVLASAPPDADGVWPCFAVRELIELTRSKEIERGIVLGVRNRRGATSRGLMDGGVQERGIAETYRSWSGATELEWPRTSALLERIAASYESEARWHDEDAERNQW